MKPLNNEMTEEHKECARNCADFAEALYKLREQCGKLNILYILGVLRLHENETTANEQSNILAKLQEILEGEK